ncbi:MAG TPA: hypothetical protein VD948_10235 [Rhodothermales bacterium]|nr:hypothetical protein [Rhodothermales bacterium]
MTGIGDALAPGPLRLTKEHMGRAEGLPRAIRRRLRKFLAAKGPWPAFGKVPPFKYDTVLEELPMVTPQRLQENVDRFPDQPLADAYMAALGRMVGWLQSVFPVRVRESITGIKNVEPRDMKLAEFRRAWWIADSPLRVLDSLNTGLLVADEVEALRQCYPTLHAEVLNAALELIVQRKAEAPRWELPYERERKLKILLGAQGDDAQMKAAVRDAFERAKKGAQQEEKPQAPAGGKPGKFVDPSTPTQRGEAQK